MGLTPEQQTAYATLSAAILARVPGMPVPAFSTPGIALLGLALLALGWRVLPRW